MRVVSTNLPDLKVVRKYQAVMKGYNEKFVFAEIEYVETGWYVAYVCGINKRKEIDAKETLRAAKLAITNWYKKNVCKRGERIWKAWKWEVIENGT